MPGELFSPSAAGEARAAVLGEVPERPRLRREERGAGRRVRREAGEDADVRAVGGDARAESGAEARRAAVASSAFLQKFFTHRIARFQHLIASPFN